MGSLVFADADIESFCWDAPALTLGAWGAFERIFRNDFPRTSDQFQMRCFGVGKGGVARHGGSEGLLCVGVE